MIKFSDFVDGITVHEQVDDVTGLTSTVVLDPNSAVRAQDLRPVVRLTNAKVRKSPLPTPTFPAVYALPAAPSSAWKTVPRYRWAT